MENIEVARLLEETADLMEIAGEDPFRIRSYRNAKTAIESYPERVLDMLKDPGRKVTDISGIGKGIAAVFAEIAERGSFERRDEMLSKYPPTALELLKIQGLGPKSIRTIYEQFRVSTIDGLERICQEGKLRALPRMGEKLEQKVLRSIAQYRRSSGRFLLSFADATAQEVVSLLQQDGVDSITPAGSLRRGKETAGDVDILVAGPRATEALDTFANWSRISELLGKGEGKASGRIGVEGIQVDVRAVPVESYGAAMQYFTGSKEHNVALRQRALKMGLTLNEYGLAKLAGGERVAGATEEEIYKALGLSYIPPELRENRGEIEAVLSGELPDLVELAQIRGDIHMHTTATDGRATLEEMALAAKSYAYEYIAITDHSKALAMANGLDEKRAVEFAHRVKEMDHAALGIKVFSGLECDILRDGKMDLDRDALDELDVVIGSVHSYMNLEPAEMTDRLLGAIEHPSVQIIGHPTGRLLLHRDAYAYDFERIAAAAAKYNVALEINASPERLDIHSSLIRTAKAKGCKFTISTDAHHPKHLANMTYGVKTARRGWLGAGDILNTAHAGDFLRHLRARK